ncbi:MAG: hypothetical protein ACOX2S_10185 [bacterium]|jgi:hypothetical protein
MESTLTAQCAKKQTFAEVMRAAWLLNAATVSFVEARQLLSEIATTFPDLVAHLGQSSAISTDGREFLQREITRFNKECELLAAELAQARRAANGD